MGNLPVLGWRVYTSTATYTSDPQSIPADVQAVVYFHAYPYRMVEYGNDEYVVDGVTLLGREIDEAEYYKIVDKALADMEWTA